MYSLINGAEVLNRGEKASITLTRLITQQRVKIKTVTDHYQKNLVPIKRDNPFLRLLYSFGYDNNSIPLDWYNRADRDRLTLAAGVAFTTEANEGELHRDVFWGSTPVVINAGSFTRPTELLGLSSWREIQPIRVIVTPTISYSLTRPDIAKAQSGYGVVSVDMAALAFMYKSWDAINQQKPLEERERPENFLARFVFPSMIKSQYDAVMIAGLNQDIIDPEIAGLQELPFLISDKTPELLTELVDLAMDFGGDATFEQILKNMPSSQYEDLLTSVTYTKLDIATQNRWAELAASIPVVTALLRHTQNNPEADELSLAYRRAVRRYVQENTIRKIDDKEFRFLLGSDYDVMDIYNY